MMRRRRTPRAACGSLYSPAESGPRWVSASRIRRVCALRSRSAMPTMPAMPHIPSRFLLAESRLDLRNELLHVWFPRLDRKDGLRRDKRLRELAICGESSDELSSYWDLVSDIRNYIYSTKGHYHTIRRPAKPYQDLRRGNVETLVV